MAALIYKTVSVLRPNRKFAYLAAGAWLLNPFAIWSIEFQGSYAILASTLFVLGVYLLLKQKLLLAAMAFAASASIYYYAIVLIPFIAYYVLKNYTFKKAVKVCFIFLGILSAFYLPFFLDRGFLGDLSNSLMNHSAPSSGQYETVTYLPKYSLLNVPYYITHGELPNDQSAPSIFTFLKYLNILGVALIGSMILMRFVSKKTRVRYPFRILLYDITVSLIIFMVFVGQFQDHYLSWLIPILIVIGFAYKSPVLIIAQYFILATLAIIFGSNNLGIYLLDIVPFGTISFYSPRSTVIQALGGFTIFVLLLASAYMIRTKTKLSLQQAQAIGVMNLIVIVCIGVFSAVGVLSSTNASVSKLGSDQNVSNFAYYSPRIFSPIYQRSEHHVAEFEGRKFDVTTGRYNLNESVTNSRWYLYKYKGNNTSSVSVSSEGINNLQSVNFDARPGDAMQMNLGSNRSSTIPVNQYNKYISSVYVRYDASTNVSPSLTIRFLNENGEVISGSDQRSRKVGDVDGWSKYELHFTVPQKAHYVEPLLTVDYSNPRQQTPARVQFSGFYIASVRDYQVVDITDVRPKNNANSIYREVLNDETEKFFSFKVRVDKDEKYQRAEDVTLNACKPYDRDDTRGIATFWFSSSCVKADDTSDVKVVTSNIASDPIISMSLVHNAAHTHSVSYHRRAFALTSVSGTVVAVASIVTVSGMCFVICRRILVK